MEKLIDVKLSSGTVSDCEFQIDEGYEAFLLPGTVADSFVDAVNSEYMDDSTIKVELTLSDGSHHESVINIKQNLDRELDSWRRDYPDQTEEAVRWMAIYAGINYEVDELQEKALGHDLKNGLDAPNY